MSNDMMPIDSLHRILRMHHRMRTEWDWEEARASDSTSQMRMKV